MEFPIGKTTGHLEMSNQLVTLLTHEQTSPTGIVPPLDTRGNCPMAYVLSSDLALLLVEHMVLLFL